MISEDRGTPCTMVVPTPKVNPPTIIPSKIARIMVDRKEPLRNFLIMALRTAVTSTPPAPMMLAVAARPGFCNPIMKTPTATAVTMRSAMMVALTTPPRVIRGPSSTDDLPTSSWSPRLSFSMVFVNGLDMIPLQVTYVFLEPNKSISTEHAE